jgi:hypothetical protein
VVADLSAEAVAVVILPGVARGAELGRFQHFEGIITSLSGGLANALYTLATSLLAWAARGWLPRYASVAAVVVALSGVILTIAAVVGLPRGMVWSNVVLVPALLAWLWGVSSAARTLR